jgi:hypothetical protein
MLLSLILTFNLVLAIIFIYNFFVRCSTRSSSAYSLKNQFFTLIQKTRLRNARVHSRRIKSELPLIVFVTHSSVSYHFCIIDYSDKFIHFTKWYAAPTALEYINCFIYNSFGPTDVLYQLKTQFLSQFSKIYNFSSITWFSVSNTRVHAVRGLVVSSQLRVSRPRSSFIVNFSSER